MLNNRVEKSSGFSLVELLISMALGLILISGMIAVFSGSKRTSELTSEMANMQESARFALQTIAEDLRSAGFQGCLGLGNGRLTDVTGTQVLNGDRMFLTAATGSVILAPNNWQPAPIGNFIAPNTVTPVAGTHSIAMRGATQNRLKLESPMIAANRPSEAAPLILEEGMELQALEGAPMIISDCEQADLFSITARNNVNNSWVITHTIANNTTANLGTPYGNNGSLGQVTVTPFFQNLYFVGTTGQTTENGDEIRSLYQQSWPFNSATNPPVEIIQGIENLRVSFGIQNAQGRVQYVQANDAAFNGGAVVSVQIGILMTSWDRIATIDDNNTYVLAGQPIEAASNSADGTNHAIDKRYRLAFNTTVKVRNRRMQSQ